MGTITQEIDRINSGKNSIIESTNTKLEAQGSQPIPANTKIDEISPYIDAIQQGGQENAFFQKTNLDYTFYYSDLTEHGNFEALKRLSQNNITSLKNTFTYASYTQQADFDECLEYIRKTLTNMQLDNISGVLSYFLIYSSNTIPQDIPILDLTDLNLNLNCSAENAFSYFLRYSNRYLKVKFKKDTFNKCNTVSNIFANINNGLTLIIENNELDFSNSGDCSSIFKSFNGIIEDFNGNSNKIINIKLNQSRAYSLYSAFNASNFERINFDDTKKCNYYSSAFNYCNSLKSITGLDFSGLTSTPIRAFDGGTYTNFGELGIINGSTLGKALPQKLEINRIWNADKSTVRDGQTIEYWYEKFANALGNSETNGTQTITISSALYNSLTQAQIELITNKGYMLASA